VLGIMLVIGALGAAEPAIGGLIAGAGCATLGITAAVACSCTWLEQPTHTQTSAGSARLSDLRRGISRERIPPWVSERVENRHSIGRCVTRTRACDKQRASEMVGATNRDRREE
jgi:hypothetical protein